MIFRARFSPRSLVGRLKEERVDEERRAQQPRLGRLINALRLVKQAIRLLERELQIV